MRPTIRPSRSTMIARKSSVSSALMASFRCSSLGQDEAPLHDVLRLLDQVKVDVPLLGDAVAAMTQFNRIDRFADQRSPDAGRHRHRDDDRNNDGVIARHFENHDNRCHDSACSGTDHRSHSDDGS